MELPDLFQQTGVYPNPLGARSTRPNSKMGAPEIGGAPTTPDPNTSAKVSRYKWEAYRDTNWRCIYYFLPREQHTFAKVSR